MDNGLQLKGKCCTMFETNIKVASATILAIVSIYTSACASAATSRLQPTSTTCTDPLMHQMGFCAEGNNGDIHLYGLEHLEAQSSGQASSGGGSSTLDEQRAQKTADNTPDPRALAYAEWARCKAPRPRVRCGKRAWT